MTLPAGLRNVSRRSDVAPLRVLIVDDHQLVRDGLRHLLEGCLDLEVVAEAGSVAEAVKRVALERPDVVVLALVWIAFLLTACAQPTACI